MFISRFRLTNFKSYRETLPIEFTPGLNVIVGQNNAGKSALLEALALEPAWNPHRSPITLSFEGARPISSASLEVSFSVSRTELLEMIDMGGEEVFLPFPALDSPVAQSIAFRNDSPPSHHALAKWFVAQDQFTFALTYTWNHERSQWAPTVEPSFGLYPVKSPARSAGFRLGTNGALVPTTYRDSGIDLGVQLVAQFRRQVYVFRAERLNVGECGLGNDWHLHPNASNLPSVLNLLQSNRMRFDDFNKTVRSILPQVPSISVRPSPTAGGILEVIVWPFEADPAREDLIVPLRDSGTGLGQVLAIMYVVLASKRPSVIVIDEPQSFLHPGAARKLMEVLKAYPQHQYIVSTHAPSIVSAADLRTVTIARLEAGETKLTQLSTEQATAHETLLAEVGARLSDVFGSDSILWVEGQTEEICYRRICRDLVRRSLLGKQILGVRHTGDLEGGLAERTLEIYNKITSSNSLIPPAVAFLFDSECLSEQRKGELATKSHGLLHFLDRRMYENFLLVPEGIADVANDIDGFSPKRILTAEVSVLLQAVLEDRQYYCSKVVPKELTERLLRSHAKKVLRKIFADLSESRVRYDEVEHGLKLTEWIISNKPELFDDIRDRLESFLT